MIENDFEFQMICAKSNILNIRQRIDISLQEIKEKQPNREDYILPMTDSIDKLLSCYYVLDILEKELRISRQRNSDLEMKLLILKQKYDNLRKDYDEMQELWK